jgi:hypothetical protein
MNIHIEIRNDDGDFIATINASSVEFAYEQLLRIEKKHLEQPTATSIDF